MMQHIPRGVESRRQHEPLCPDREDCVASASHRGACLIHEPLDSSTLGPIRFDPSRPTVLEAEIKAVIGEAMETMDYDRAARRILKIDRIRRALSLLNTIDNPRPTPHSSDAR